MSASESQQSQSVSLARVIEGKVTYPSWTTQSSYRLQVKSFSEDEIIVFYQIKRGRLTRVVERRFPAKVIFSPRFCWVLGFIKGEGANKLGKSNYRRVTVTNSNAHDLKIVLDELESQKLLHRKQLRGKSVQIFARSPTEETMRHWRKMLGLKNENIVMFKKENVRSLHGVCHIYVSDVLLRRVIDILQGELMDTFAPAEVSA